MATTLDETRSKASMTRAGGTDSGAVARYVNIIAGAWLFISAFIWPHSASSRTNTWIVGALAVIFAIIALRTPPVRFLNTALAVWLFFSTLAFFHVSGGTLWNNIIVSIVLFVASLVPSGALGVGDRHRRYASA